MNNFAIEINKLNKISEGVKKKLKCSFRAVKRSRGGGREGLYILSEKEVYLPKAAQRDYYSICLFEMIFEGAGWKVGFSVAPETREFWLDNKKVGEKNNFSRDIADYRNKLYAKDQEVGKVFDELIKEIDRFVSSLPLKKEKYDMILFGLPFYKKNQIRGWDRVSYPPEFLINVFGQNEQNEDKLYVMAKKEGN